MTVYGGARPTPPPPAGSKPDKLLLGAAGFAVLALIAGIVFAVQAFTKDDPQSAAAPQYTQSGPAGSDSAPAPPPPTSDAPSPTPSPTPTQPKPAILAAKPSLVRPDHSGLCLQANGGNGANATQQPCDANNPTELWVPQALGGSQDTFQFVNAADNRCLSVANNAKDNLAQLWLWDCHADIGQTFKMVPDSGGYRFLNPNSNRCMSIEGGNPNPGALAKIWDCNGAADQRWKFQPLG
jgi:hypothetical protein